jgi:hypothetical protein
MLLISSWGFELVYGHLLLTWRTLFSISHQTGMLSIDLLGFCLSWNVFHLHFWKMVFPHIKLVDSHYGSTLSTMSFHCLWLLSLMKVQQLILLGTSGFWQLDVFLGLKATMFTKQCISPIGFLKSDSYILSWCPKAGPALVTQLPVLEEIFKVLST